MSDVRSVVYSADQWATHWAELMAGEWVLSSVARSAGKTVHMLAAERDCRMVGCLDSLTAVC